MPKIWGPPDQPRPRPFNESYLCIQLAFHPRSYWPNLKSVAQIIFKIFGVVCHNFYGSHDLGHTPLGGNYRCARSAFPRQSGVPNLKSLAQVVLTICSIVCQKIEGSRDLGHAPFGKIILARPNGFSKRKLNTEFKVSSLSSFENMFECMPKILGVKWPGPRPFWGKLF